MISWTNSAGNQWRMSKPSESCKISLERKRGKLIAINEGTLMLMTASTSWRTKLKRKGGSHWSIKPKLRNSRLWSKINLKKTKGPKLKVPGSRSSLKRKSSSWRRPLRMRGGRAWPTLISSITYRLCFRRKSRGLRKPKRASNCNCSSSNNKSKMKEGNLWLIRQRSGEWRKFSKIKLSS